MKQEMGSLVFVLFGIALIPKFSQFLRKPKIFEHSIIMPTVITAYIAATTRKQGNCNRKKLNNLLLIRLKALHLHSLIKHPMGEQS